MEKELFLKMINSRQRTMNELFTEANRILYSDNALSNNTDEENPYVIYVPLFELDELKSGVVLKEYASFVYPVARFYIQKNNNLKIRWDYRDIEGDVTIFDKELSNESERFDLVWDTAKESIFQAVCECIGVKNPCYKDDGTIEGFSLFESEYLNEEEIAEKSNAFFNGMGYRRESNSLTVKYAPNGRIHGSRVRVYIPVHDRGCDDLGNVCSDVYGYLFIDDIY